MNFAAMNSAAMNSLNSELKSCVEGKSDIL